MPAMLTDDTYGTLAAPATLTLQRLLPGPIERIWAYLTESEKRKQWFAAGDYELKKGGKANLFFQHKNISKPGTTPPEAFRKMHAEGH
ncbi:MAG: SRPBCC domain-containing protein, partial [Sphingopyxis sp.]|nr:SRPBCC domain-containing protein [Sphingopyxis sp.]